MTKRNVNEESYDELDIGVLARAYVENKREADSYKKICDEENKQLKRRMAEEGIESVYVGYGKALKRTVTSSYEVNEAKMLKVLKKYNVPATKVVEVIDEEALEKFLYNADPEETKELLSDLALCKTEKEVVSLRVVNAKKSED